MTIKIMNDPTIEIEIRQNGIATLTMWSLTLLIIPGVLGYYSIIYGIGIIKAISAISFLSSMFLLFFGCWRLLQLGYDHVFPYYYKFLLYFLLLIGLFAALRGLEFNFKSFTDTFAITSTGFSWLVPVALLLGSQLYIWKKLLTLFAAHVVFGIIVFFILFLARIDFLNESPEYLNWFILYPSGFMILNWKNQKPYVTIIGFLGIFFFTVNGWLMGRRYLVLIASIFFVFFLRSYTFRTKSILQHFCGVCAFIVVLYATVWAIPKMQVYTAKKNYRQDTQYNRIISKGFNNSRENLTKDLLRDLSVAETIFGKGALGSYRSAVLRSGVHNRFRERLNIEIGYLQVIFKGGVLMLSFFILITLPAVILGLFRSSNSLTLAASLVVLNRLIEMFVFGLPMASNSYILFWLCVGACLTPTIRNMSDTVMSKYFYSQRNSKENNEYGLSKI